ncbi:Choline-sulfatase [Pontiella desulfatans]|uniref:Choline-sulfatase n=1 Tax=Pontiella desulfatans TaxID=2750659 RepID=A0A6C2TY43_PONDE|nr:sulfatase [Pontiella desulfatans]SPS73661.1 sulfatase S1_8 [Kiritimatiellales bacterium]VGO12364.1 Choline-sulfatase [Pontiella desulfatans]
MARHKGTARRGFIVAAFAISACASVLAELSDEANKPLPPNILLAISDDQSWPHASAYGCKFVNTPAFDRVANEGVLFHNAFAPAPQCSPTRASILTGRNPWKNGDAAVHGTSIPTDIPLYTDLLEKVGYHVGMTGKGWAPGLFEGDNPAGKDYTLRKGKGKGNYTGAFQSFLKERKSGQPFCFWYGAREPHRGYKVGSGLKAGKTLESVAVPKFLADDVSVRSDMLDYALEIERFDAHLGRMLEILEESGELDNTLVVVTSDNGMPWSRAKANIYEYGVHMPLAIRWGTPVPPKRNVDDLVSLIDLAPTFLQASGQPVPKGVSGRSLLEILKSGKSGRVDASRDCVVVGQERHTPYVRENDVGYPGRAIRTDRYLFIRNLKPGRWPEGDTFYGAGGSTSRTLYIYQCENPAIQPYLRLAWAKRPAEELYDIKADPDCINNLAGNPEHAQEQNRLRDRLNKILAEQKDPRIAGDDRYDEQPYFKGDFWKEKRLAYLQEAEKVHQAMETAGWKHGRIASPLTKPKTDN